MSFTTHQIQKLAEICEFPSDFLVPGVRQRAIAVDSGYALSLAGDRVVMEKLRLSPTYESHTKTWFVMYEINDYEFGVDATDRYPDPSQAIESAVIAYLTEGGR